MYVGTQSGILSPRVAMPPGRRRRGFAGFLTPATGNIPGATPLNDATLGLPAGFPCYDSTHDPGLIHGCSTVDSFFFSNCTTALSAAESACLAGQLTNLNPSTPTNYNPETGTAVSGTDLSPAPVVTSPIPCAGGGVDCQPIDTSACAWYCNLPFASSLSPTFDTDCVGCAASNLSPFLMIGAAVIVGVLLLAAVQR
jgi:hypothetical protein